MTEGSLFTSVLAFAIPLMLSSLLQLLFNAIDTVVVGTFAGTQSLAAVSSTSSLINLVTNLFIGLSVGTNVVVARHLGAQDYINAHKAVQTSILVALTSGVFLTIICVIGARQFLVWMNCPENVISLSTVYLRIYFLSIPAILLYNFGAAILRAAGDTQRPLYFLTIAGVLNASFNLLFVVVFQMDVAGVGWATVISQYTSGALILLSLTKQDGPISVNLKRLKVDKQQLIEIAKVGLPAGIQGTVFSLSNVLIQSSINSFGDTVMAGNGAASSIEGFVYVCMNTFYQSCMTFTSANIGSKKYDRINKILLVNLFYGVLFGVVLGQVVVHFPTFFLSIYNKDPEVIAAGTIRFNYVCKWYFLCGIMDILVGSLRGIGYSTLPMINSLLGACAFRVVWLKTIFVIYGTIESVYISYPISWIITACAHLIYFLVVRYRLNQKPTLKTQTTA